MATNLLRDVQRLLAVRLDNIGDIVMLGPSLRALRRSLPNAHITLMASPAGSQVAPLLPWIDEVFTWQATWQEVGGNGVVDPQREFTLIEKLREGSYDAAVIFTSFSQSPHPPAYACYLAGIPLRVGHSKEFSGQVLSHCAKPPDDSGHQVDRNLALIELLGLPVNDRNLELHLQPQVLECAYQLLANVGVSPNQPYIMLVPGASCSARRYSAERYARVALGLTEKSGLPVIIAGSAREMGRVQPVITAAENSAGVISLVGATDVPQFAALLSRAELVLANNSSALHIADAFARPLVVTYSGTEYESQWRPRQSIHRLLRVPTQCSPCYRFTCPYNRECLDIDPEEVIQVGLDMLHPFAPVEALTATWEKNGFERSKKNLWVQN